MNELRAAASPMRKLNRGSHVRASLDSQDSPRSQPDARRRVSRVGRDSSQNSPGALNVVGGIAMTPMKRVPILANFEEWMKMATDNKINAANSWNFALIDYFHDMSLLKEGDGVNFQKASCTLDGCVKIYTSRVDSVATETGRLLSGLADSGDNKGKKAREGADAEDGENGEEGDEEDEEGSKKKTKRKQARSHEATLAPSFASLQLKKLELDFAVDPLFKKASADFDEGGAKGLLLNHLSIDSEGRIVFDSSDDAGDAALAAEQMKQQQGENEETTTTPTSQEATEDDEDIDLGSLGAKFFPDLSILDSQDICPSMKSFKLGDPSSDLTIPFLKAPNDWREKGKSESPEKPSFDANLNLADQTGIFLDGTNALGFDDDDNGGMLGGFDIPEDVGFGEGGEAWARDAAVEHQMRVAKADDNGALDDNLIEGNNADGYAVSLQHRYREDAEHESILAYFDKAFNSRAKGKNAFVSLENWRILKIQKAKQAETAPARREKKEKEPLEIDFLGPISDSLQELIEAVPVNNSTISLPKGQWKTKGRNLLDKDDEVIDTRKLMRLWTKPKCRVGRKRGEMTVIDEGFGARGQDFLNKPIDEEEDDEGRKGDYDANFFADDEQILPFDVPLPIDDDDDLDLGDPAEEGFMDAREMLSPPPESQTQHANLLDDDNTQRDPDTQLPTSSQTEMLPGSFGSQLVTQGGRRLRPEYVNYARTAKKVDVRRLKENMWKGMASNLVASMTLVDPALPPTPALSSDDSGDVEMMDLDDDAPAPPAEKHEAAAAAAAAAAELKFTDMIGDLRNVYPEQQMKDISTSYCFIVLLHLANEKGLVLDGGREDGAMEEIMVSRDASVGEGYVGE